MKEAGQRLIVNRIKSIYEPGYQFTVRQAIGDLMDTGFKWTPTYQCIKHIFLLHKNEIRVSAEDPGRVFLYEVVA